jgi:hypothetical protein
MVPFTDKKVGQGCSRTALLDFEEGVQLEANEIWLCSWILKGVKSHCRAGCLDLTSAKSDRSMTAVKLEGLTSYARRVQGSPVRWG